MNKIKAKLVHLSGIDFSEYKRTTTSIVQCQIYKLLSAGFFFFFRFLVFSFDSVLVTASTEGGGGFMSGTATTANQIQAKNQSYNPVSSDVI